MFLVVHFSLNSNYANISVVKITTQSTTINANSPQNFQTSLASISGTPIGIVGFKPSTNTGNVPYFYYILDKTLYFGIRNITSSSNTQTFDFYILIKD